MYEDKKFVDIDFETYYDKEYSLKNMSTWNYVFDKERFDAYLVSVYGEDIEFVGNPKDFDWHKLDGCTLVIHNAHFDGMVIERLKQEGIIPKDFKPYRLVDTADMAVFLRAPRNLKGAVKELLGIDMDKAPRDKMKGKTWAQAVAMGLKDTIVKYGGLDAKYSYDLWMKYHHLWPDDEQRLSEYNRNACWKGIPIATDKLKAAVDTLKIQVWEAENNIPWHGEDKPLAPKAIRAQCAKDGISCPSSFAATSEEATAWENKYCEKFPWVKAIKIYRSMNAHAKKVFSLNSGTRPDGTFPFQIKYHGAGPGRFSAGGESGGKFNMLNQPQEEMFDVDIRDLFYAGDGYSFIILDYSQVECRLLLWRAGDEEMLARIRAGESPYEAHARVYMGWTGGLLKKENPAMYKLAKARVLGAGYQCGWERFILLAWVMAGLKITAAESKKTITDYRAKNTKIVDYWRRHQNGMIISAHNNDPVHEVELVSGRVLSYFNPRRTPVVKIGSDKKPYNSFEYTASIVRGDEPVKLYGGKLTENEIQATARDLLKDGILALVDEAFEVPFTVYDEYVVRVKDEDVEKSLVRIPQILKVASPWAAGCPIDLESQVVKYYTK